MANRAGDWLAQAERLLDKARVLDGFYVSSRYPNGFPEGAPFEHFGALHSREALDHAREILEYVRFQMA